MLGKILQNEMNAIKRNSIFYIGIAITIALTACQSEPDGFPGTRTPLRLTPSPAATSTPLLPLPSATPSAPPATHIPQATPTSQRQLTILLSEDFSGDQSCMESFDNERAQGRMDNGVYVLEVYAADEIVNANCETLVAGDFSLDVDISVEAFTPGGSYYFGLLFRVSGDERYAFVIGNEGGYCIYYARGLAVVPFTNSTDFTVQCWALIPEIALVEGRQHLRVVAVGDRMDVYLNGVLLAVVRDNQLREGWVGFVVATAGVGGVRVTFDNLIVARP
ncbi:MAG: hypothetical protein IH859_00775 [Chloroflexi bacterium]|nr:hypothetical protein [Chloroflexota bacterium]